MAKVEWQKVKLNELGFVGRGKSRHRPRNAAFLYGGLYPFFQTGDIKAAGLYLKEYTQTYSEEGLAQSKLWEPGTLCITIAANIAESAILGIKGCFPDSIVGFIADPQKADVRFIKYYIDTLKLEMQSISRGTTQDNLSLDKLLTIDFNIPPIPLQHRIADTLSTYDDLIENCQRRIKILEEMARNLYREWFVRFRFPGYEKVEMVSSPLGEIPEGWEVKRLDELVTTQYGYTESSTEFPLGPKYLRGMDINKTSYIDWSQVPYCKISLEEKKNYCVKKGDIFIIRMADPGKVGIAEQNVDAVFASYLIRIKPIDLRVQPYFLYYLFNSSAYQNYISGASTGTTRKSASAGVITDFQFVLPPQNIIYNFEIMVSTLRCQLIILIQQIQALRRTRDLLLPRLMSGELDVR
jgi:type I restriction enzyme S subunit